MSRMPLWLMLIGCVVSANADAVLTLDNGSPTPDGVRYDWVYSLSVTDGTTFNALSSVTIFGVAGVGSGDASASHGWSGGVNPPVGGVADVVFTNQSFFLTAGDPNPCVSTCDGFTIVSDYGNSALLNYAINWGVDPSILGPTAVPEPSSWAMLLTGMAALSLVAFRRTERARLRH
jgi:hypothetical protein